MASLTIMDINDYKKNALEFWDYYIDLYGIEPTFRTYVDNQAVATSKEHVKVNFEFYKMGWSLIDKDVSKSQEVYDAFFNDEVLDYSYSSEGAIVENNRIMENAQDPNVKIYEPDYMNDIYKNSSIIDTSNDEDIFKVKCHNCSKTIYADNKSKNNICKECKAKEPKTNNSSYKVLLVIILCLIIYYFKEHSLVIIAGAGIVLGFLYDEFGRKKR